MQAEIFISLFEEPFGYLPSAQSRSPPGPARDKSPFTVGISELLGEGDRPCASTCGKCTNPAFKFPLCDPPHWLNLISEPNIKGSENDESIKLSAVFAAGNLKFSIAGVWIRLLKMHGSPSIDFSTFEVRSFWNTDVRD